MERSFEKKEDQKQHGTLKQEDRKDRKHEGTGETRPERPLPAEAGNKGDKDRDEHQPKVLKSEGEHGKKIKRDEEQPKVAAKDEDLEDEDEGLEADQPKADEPKEGESTNEGKVEPTGDEAPSQGI